MLTNYKFVKMKFRDMHSSSRNINVYALLIIKRTNIYKLVGY